MQGTPYEVISDNTHGEEPGDTRAGITEVQKDAQCTLLRDCLLHIAGKFILTCECNFIKLYGDYKLLHYGGFYVALSSPHSVLPTLKQTFKETGTLCEQWMREGFPEPLRGHSYHPQEVGKALTDLLQLIGQFLKVRVHCEPSLRWCTLIYKKPYSTRIVGSLTSRRIILWRHTFFNRLDWNCLGTLFSTIQRLNVFVFI